MLAGRSAAILRHSTPCVASFPLPSTPPSSLIFSTLEYPLEYTLNLHSCSSRNLHLLCPSSGFPFQPLFPAAPVHSTYTPCF